MKTSEKMVGNIRFWIGIFIFGLIVSGLTAFPILTEIRLLERIFAGQSNSLAKWILFISEGIKISYAKYPFIAYGTDWLGYSHLVISLFFIDVYRNPKDGLKTVWIGLLACLGVIPLALIAGHIREVPIFWRMIDCSFGIFGAIPLLISHRNINKLLQFSTDQSR
ncbi:MAG: hypothetical protein K9H64_08300 [Bacteroidales bacterium]|nr:hypothetical protein [Bacteroidales bacterium]MCF8455832.1 hypothetical protein [Bacteroidales bacterium]